MKHSSLWRGLVAVAALLVIVARTEANPNGVAPVRKVILENGLTVLVREDHSAPVAAVQTWCRAGSITEGKWMGAGLSHVLEHMLFKGTTTRGCAAVAQEIERKGGYINAYTSYERTVYHIDMPSENWQTAVDILADCMMNATIPEVELTKEKRVILREMAMNNDDPDRRLHWTFWNTAYTTHPYRYTVIGYPDIFNRSTREDVFAYYKKFYVPNNLMFVVVGDVNADTIIARIRELTKDFRMNAMEPAALPVEPPQVAMRERHEEMDVQVSSLMLGWHIPGLTHADTPVLDVLAIVLGNGRSSRLYREVQQKQGLVHEISAGAYTPTYPGLFLVDASADADKRDAATATIRQEIKNLAQNPISKEECQKAVKMTLAGHLAGLKTMDGQADDIGSNEFSVSDPDYSKRYLEKLRKVTPADIQRVAALYLHDDNLTVVSINPLSEKQKTATAVTTSAGIAIQKFVLPNGIRLLVREDPKLPLVDIKAIMRGGVLVETADDNGITRLMANMLLKGTATRTADEISGSLESVGGGIAATAGNNSVSISAQVMSEDLDLGLNIVSDVLKNPSFPSDKLTRERDVQLSEIRSEQDEVMKEAFILLRKSMFKTHPFRLSALGSSNVVAKLTREDLRAFHRRYVVGGNLVLTVFGNVKTEDVRKQVTALFGSLPAKAPDFPKLAAESLAASVRKEEPKNREQSVLLIGYSGVDMFNSDRFALQLIDEAFSGQGSRLFLRLRDELGLCYYCGATQLTGASPGFFAFYVGTTPQKVALCEKEIVAEIERLQKDGLTTEELDRAKNSIIGQRKVKIQDNAELGLLTGLDELYGLGYGNFKADEASLRAVTTNDIKRVAAAYFTGKPNAVVVLNPGKKEK